MEWWKDISEIIRNFGLLAAAVTGVALAWQRVKAANKQAEISRRDHFSELFNRAVGQLADEKLEIRLGAVYTLEQISDDFPDLSVSVIKLLETFLRENPVDYGEMVPPADRREIFRIVAKKLENSK